MPGVFYLSVIALLPRAEGPRAEPHTLKNIKPVDLTNFGCHVIAVHTVR